jgi:hypothetical protein
MMSVVEQKKEFIRVALQELESPASTALSAYDAMITLHQAVVYGFDDEEDDDGSIGDYVGDDEFKLEIFAARVVQVVLDVSQDKEAFSLNFYHLVCGILSLICWDNAELATTFVANSGVEFLLERLEAFSSDRFLLISCFWVHRAVIESLDDNASADFAGLTLAKIVDVFELNSETQDEQFYLHYCLSVGSSFGPPGREVNGDLLERIVSHVWHGVIKHKHDEDAQDTGRSLLSYLVGKESAKEMIDHAEMHHCEDEECAGCA